MSSSSIILYNFLTSSIVHVVDKYMSIVKFVSFKNVCEYGKEYVWFNFANEYQRWGDSPAFINIDDFSIRERWYQHGKLHRTKDLPALIDYSISDGEKYIKRLEWYQHGKLHRGNDSPASINYTLEDVTEEWYQNGELYRSGAPAKIFYYCQDLNPPLYDPQTNLSRFRIYPAEIYAEQWYSHNVLSRDDGPAHITYFEDKTVELEEWYSNGSLHRIDAPAYIEYYPNGAKKYENWHRHNEPYRNEGYAYNAYEPDGKIKAQFFLYVNGIFIHG